MTKKPYEVWQIRRVLMNGRIVEDILGEGGAYNEKNLAMAEAEARNLLEPEGGTPWHVECDGKRVMSGYVSSNALASAFMRLRVDHETTVRLLAKRNSALSG